jgi:hypothetical protein
MGVMAIKRKCKKHLWGDAFNYQPRDIHKAKFRVVIWMTQQAAALGAQGFKWCLTLSHKVGRGRCGGSI